MRDTMILVADIIKEERLHKLNEELVKFGSTRGLWCSEGTMMIPTEENIEKLIEQLKQMNIKTILTETELELSSRIDQDTLHEKFKENGISCLCKRENVIIGIPDASLLTEHKQTALLLYDDEADIPAMKAYIDSKGVVMHEVSYATELNEQQQTALLEKILDQDIDMVVMPKFDYFNVEDYTTQLLFNLLKHGIHIHIAEVDADISQALNEYFYAQDEELKSVQEHELMC